MADIRINALAGTATSSASDDYLAIDGAANGTRKLSAYSPTFGGNVTTGVTQIGTGIAGFAEFSATAFFNTTDYCLIQNGSGKTQINAALGQSTEIRSNRNVLAATFTNGNTILAGNLTATGSSGNYLEAPNQNPPSLGSTGGTLRLLYQSQYGLLTGVAGTGNSWMQAQRVDGTGTAYNLLLQPSGGNVLLGTTTDSSNGKLQLATHTTSAGGIGFGTDTSLFRVTTNKLELRGTADAEFSFSFNRTAGSYQTKWENYIAAAGTSLVWYNGGDRFTLDTSGNATLGGNVFAFGGTGVTAYTDATARVYNQSGVGLTLNGSNIQLRTGSSGTTALTLDSSQRTILSGALRLNNAYTAGAVVSTGYVTIQDSTGTTYKVPVSL